MERGSEGSGGGGGGTKLARIVEAPLRALCKARDLYVSSMTGIADRASHRGVVGYPVPAASVVPGSSRFHPPRGGSSGEDDLRELVRAASQRAGGGSNLSPGGHSVGGSAVVPRSQSAGMARIDEDRPCDFGGDAMAVGPLCPRSKSCQVPKRRVRVID